MSQHATLKEAVHESTGQACFSMFQHYISKQYQEVLSLLSKAPSTSFGSSCWWIGSMKCWMVTDPKRRPLSTFLGHVRHVPDPNLANVTKTIFRFWAPCIVDARAAIALSLAFELSARHTDKYWPILTYTDLRYLQRFQDISSVASDFTRWIAWRQARTNAKSLRPTSDKTPCRVKTLPGIRGTGSRTIRTKPLAGGCKPSCSKPTIIACFQLFSGYADEV